MPGVPVLRKGDRLGEGQLQVVRKLGEGQFAEVWEIKDVAAGVYAPHVSRCNALVRPRACTAAATCPGGCGLLMGRAMHKPSWSAMLRGMGP
jgi:hypothetical protein